MAMIQFRGSVPPLNNATRVTIAMPDLLPADGRLWRVLWLLGDEGEMSDALSRKLDTEALSRRTGCAVVMPEGLHSDYENMQRGLRWYDYITAGLPRYLRDMLPLSAAREDNFLFGIGMGGLGACRIAMRDPGFAVAYGCFGADFDVLSGDEKHSSPEFLHRMRTIYGDDLESGELLGRADPYRLAAAASDIPRMLIAGGSSAGKIAELLGRSGDVSYVYSPDGSSHVTVLGMFEKMMR